MSVIQDNNTHKHNPTIKTNNKPTQKITTPTPYISNSNAINNAKPNKINLHNTSKPKCRNIVNQQNKTKQTTPQKPLEAPMENTNNIIQVKLQAKHIQL